MHFVATHALRVKRCTLPIFLWGPSLVDLFTGTMLRKWPHAISQPFTPHEMRVQQIKKRSIKDHVISHLKEAFDKKRLKNTDDDIDHLWIFCNASIACMPCGIHETASPRRQALWGGSSTAPFESPVASAFRFFGRNYVLNYGPRSAPNTLHR